MKYCTFVNTAAFPSIPSIAQTPGPNDTIPINSQKFPRTNLISGPPESPRHGYNLTLCTFRRKKNRFEIKLTFEPPLPPAHVCEFYNSKNNSLKIMKIHELFSIAYRIK